MVEDGKSDTGIGLFDIAVVIAFIVLLVIPFAARLLGVDFFYRREVATFFMGNGGYPILGPSVAVITFGLMAVIAYSEMQGSEKYWEWAVLKLIFTLVGMAGFFVLAVWRISG